MQENPDARDLGYLLQPAGEPKGDEFNMLKFYSVEHSCNHLQLLAHSTQV